MKVMRVRDGEEGAEDEEERREESDKQRNMCAWLVWFKIFPPWSGEFCMRWGRATAVITAVDEDV